MDALRRERRPRRREALRPTRRRSSWSGRCARAAWGPTACVPGPARRLAGLGGLGRPAREGRPVPARPPPAARASTATSASLYGHFGQGCIHCRIDFDLHDRRGHRASTAPSWTRPPTSCVSYGGSLSGEHGDGQARGELLPKMFGAGAVPGLPRVQGDLGPGREDESGQDGRRLPDRREPPPRAGLQPAAARDALPVPRRPRQLRRTRPCAASASASAAARTRGRCARATW